MWRCGGAERNVSEVRDRTWPQRLALCPHKVKVLLKEAEGNGVQAEDENGVGGTEERRRKCSGTRMCMMGRIWQGFPRVGFLNFNHNYADPRGTMSSESGEGSGEEEGAGGGG